MTVTALPANLATGTVQHKVIDVSGRVLDGLKIEFLLAGPSILHDPSATPPTSLLNRPQVFSYDPNTGRLRGYDDEGNAQNGAQLIATDDPQLVGYQDLQWRARLYRESAYPDDLNLIATFEVPSGGTVDLPTDLAQWTDMTGVPVVAADAVVALKQMLYGAVDHGVVSASTLTIDPLTGLHSLYATSNLTLTIGAATDGAQVALSIKRDPGVTVTIAGVPDVNVPSSGASVVLRRVKGVWERQYSGGFNGTEFLADNMVGLVPKTKLPDLSDTYTPLTVFNATIFPLGARLTGETDDSPRVQRLVTSMLAFGNDGIVADLGRGRLDLAAGVTGSVGGNQNIHIRGAGMDHTIIRVLPSNTTGGIVLNTGVGTTGVNAGKPNPTRNAQVTFTDLSVCRIIGTNGEGNVTGTGIGFVGGVAPNTSVNPSGDNPGGGQSNPHKYNTIIQRCHIWAEDTTKGSFQFGIDVRGNFMPRITGCIIGGPYMSIPGDGREDNSPIYSGDAAIVMDNAYSWIVDHSQVWSYRIGIRDVGFAGEAGIVETCNIVGVRVGVKRTRADGNEPTFTCTSSHIHARDQALYIDGAKDVTIAHTLFYNSDPNRHYNWPSDILLLSTQMTRVIGCCFFQTACNPYRVHIRADRMNSINGSAESVVPSNKLSANYIIMGNFWGSGGMWAIEAAAGATDWTLIGNQKVGNYYGTNTGVNTTEQGPYSFQSGGDIRSQPVGTGASRVTIY